MRGGKTFIAHQIQDASHIVPHPRTLRKAREQVKWMVNDGVSRPKIKRYLIRWLCWWVNSSGIWKHFELKAQYIGSCRDPSAADFAAEALRHYRIDFTTQRRSSDWSRDCTRTRGVKIGR